jgi:asparagine synthase (glutamine-hydrolysing)
MCGIAGVHHLKSLGASALVGQMMEALAHRGPDAHQLVTFPELTLGHHRLSIIDTSEAANQPFTSEDGRYVLVFNGAIYNYLELKAKLPDYHFKTQSDTEVLLAALITWGKEALAKLNGMFAFAFWDNESKELLLVRDRYGIKPLYYAASNDTLFFASEIRAILASNQVSRKLNKAAFQYYLQYQSVLSPQTLVEGIQSVQPGWMLVINNDGISEKQWYEPTLSNDKVNIRELVLDAVKLRMRADVPVGLFLSAGIDSSLLASIIRKELDLPLHSLTVGFQEESFSEANEAEQWAKSLGCEHDTLLLKPDDLLHDLPNIINQFDTPSGDGINTFVVAREAHKKGIKVALSGLGSDELFAGYPIFKQLQYTQSQKWLLSFPQVFRKLAAKGMTMKDSSMSGLKKAELLQSDYFDLAYTYPSSRKLMVDSWWKEITQNKQQKNDLAQRLLSQTGFKSLMHKWPFLSQVSWAEFQAYLEPTLLKDTDQTSMAHGLEMRTPFLDHRLVEAALSVGDSYKMGQQPKSLLTDAFGDLLTPDIINRPKTGFTLPWNNWLRAELKDWASTYFFHLADQPWINGARLKQMWDAFQQDPNQVNWARIWYLVTLQHWLEEHQIEC